MHASIAKEHGYQVYDLTTNVRSQNLELAQALHKIKSQSQNTSHSEIKFHLICTEKSLCFVRPQLEVSLDLQNHVQSCFSLEEIPSETTIQLRDRLLEHLQSIAEADFLQFSKPSTHLTANPVQFDL